MKKLAELIAASQTPLLVLGRGVRLSGMGAHLEAALNEWGIPFVTTWGGADLMPTDHRLNLGIIGPFGHPHANEATGRADLIIAVGTPLGHGQVGSGAFAERAKLVAVNIEVAASRHKWAHFVHGDAGAILDLKCSLTPWEVRKPFQWPQDSSYGLNWAMTSLLPPESIMVVDGGGSALYTGFQSSNVKEYSRLLCSTAISAMGSGLPEAVGAAFACPDRIVTCLIGDGSLMLNLQELQTIRTHDLRIKIFVIRNNGYQAIRKTQKVYQEGRYFGTQPPQIEFPPLEKIAECFDIPLWHPSNTQEMLRASGPGICAWDCDPDQLMLHNVAGKSIAEMEWS